MSSPKKFQASGKRPTPDPGEHFARRHYLNTLFKDWIGGDTFLLSQIQSAIEAGLEDLPEDKDPLEEFTRIALMLRSESGDGPQNVACIHFDLRGKTFDPLFIRAELVRKFKMAAGRPHIFLLVRGLFRSLNPKAVYRTRTLKSEATSAMSFIDTIANRWSTPSSQVHLLYL